MTPSRRTLLTGALAAVAGATFAGGCSTPDRPRRRGPLIWATGGLDVARAREIAGLWNVAHPSGPIVQVQALPRKSDEQRQLLEIELGAGLDTIDIVDLDVIWTGQFAERGWIRRLDELEPQLREVTKRGPLDTATWDRSLWAAPYKTDVGMLFYRTDLVTGVPPTTWGELAAMGAQVARPDCAAFVADGQPYEGLTVQFLEYLWGAGGDLLGSDARTVVLDETATTTALRYLADGSAPGGLFAPAYTDLDQSAATDVFRSGGAVFLRAWPSAYADLVQDGSPVLGKVAPALLPTFHGRASSRSTPALGGSNLAVSSYSTRADEAVEVVRYIATSPDVARLLEADGLPPALAVSQYASPAADPLRDRTNEALALAKARPASPVWPAITEEIQQQVHALCTERRTVRETVDDLRRVLPSITAQR